jgi:hypothetical protein
MVEEERQQLERTPRDEEDGEWWSRHDLFKVIPRNFRYSGVALLVTTIETALPEICHELWDRRNLPLAVNDLDGRPSAVTERILKYLRTVARVRLPDSKFRPALKRLVTVRNCIAHATGDVNLMRDGRRQEQIRDAVKRLDGFNLSADGCVEIDRGICARLINEASTWLDEVTCAPTA